MPYTVQRATLVDIERLVPLFDDYRRFLWEAVRLSCRSAVLDRTYGFRRIGPVNCRKRRQCNHRFCTTISEFFLDSCRADLPTQRPVCRAERAASRRRDAASERRCRDGSGCRSGSAGVGDGGHQRTSPDAIQTTGLETGRRILCVHFVPPTLAAVGDRCASPAQEGMTGH